MGPVFGRNQNPRDLEGFWRQGYLATPNAKLPRKNYQRCLNAPPSHEIAWHLMPHLLSNALDMAPGVSGAASNPNSERTFLMRDNCEPTQDISAAQTLADKPQERIWLLFPVFQEACRQCRCSKALKAQGALRLGMIALVTQV